MPIIQACHYFPEILNLGMIKLWEKDNVLFFSSKFMNEYFGCMPGSFGGAGDKKVNLYTSFDQSSCHSRSIALTPVIQGAIDVIYGEIVPTAFSVSYYQ